MNPLTLISSLVLLIAPVKAQFLPVWCMQVAESVCTYLSLDASFKDSILQAFDDNSNWESEMIASRKRGLFGETITAALGK